MKKIPENSVIANYLERIDYADTYKIKTNSRRNAEEAAHEIFSNLPSWINAMMALRNKIVKLFGLKTAADHSKTQIFDSYFSSEAETILGKDDKHLNFRLSILLEDNESGCRIVNLTTAVQYNNKLGVVYFALIKPFHKIIVKSCLKNYNQGM